MIGKEKMQLDRSIIGNKKKNNILWKYNLKYSRYKN